WIRTSLSLIAVAVAALAGASAARAQQPAAPDAELLTLDRAIELAVRGNRTVESAEIEVDKAGDQLAATHTKRFPSVNVYVLGSQNLTPINFKFAPGVFGTYPGIGPVPATDTTISTPRQLTFTIVNRVSQPLSQLYRVGLSERLARVNVELAREE